MSAASEREELALELFQRSHEPSFSDDAQGMEEARRWAGSILDRFTRQSRAESERCAECDWKPTIGDSVLSRHVALEHRGALTVDQARVLLNRAWTCTCWPHTSLRARVPEVEDFLAAGFTRQSRADGYEFNLCMSGRYDHMRDWLDGYPVWVKSDDEWGTDNGWASDERGLPVGEPAVKPGDLFVRDPDGTVRVYRQVTHDQSRAEIQAEAWEEGRDAGARAVADCCGCGWREEPVNPYRADRIEARDA